ncbi:MAG TPA: VWA domain-containing protein [Pyrinomonadaceae bacterium]|nr:VWA domain-containing protein [Pyrinomonadaceae bacterium]
MKRFIFISQTLSIIFVLAFAAEAQSFQKEIPLKSGGLVEIINLYGRVDAQVVEENGEKVSISPSADTQISEGEIKIESSDGRIKIEAAPNNQSSRVDLIIRLPLRSRVKIETRAGEVRVAGNLASAQVYTDTGTIAADVPLENVQYNFNWTESRPRYLSDVELEKVKEKAAGRFAISGKIIDPDAGTRGRGDAEIEEEVSESEETQNSKKKNSKSKEPRTKDKGQINLNLTTARGIILLNVSPNEVPSNLQERPLTEAAKAIIRSGDSILTEAIRRSSPKYFGDYAKTLPPRKATPVLSEKTNRQILPTAQIKKVLVSVTDQNNRAISDLKAKDFEVSENGERREILSVEPTTAPFNLVLLLDVSGSVENYVDFIRKAARNFLSTVSPQDKIAIVIFNEDVKTLSTFTTNKGRLSESLDTFDAGGGTAYYDALGYTLTEILRPMRGERTGIVVLSDGDDNRSFLPFDSLLGSIQESGALVYPLYVPSELIAASASRDPNAAVDPLRSRYLSLTSKAETEGEKLAQVSGGVYYRISRLSELQDAYEDIVRQLRTAYTITFRSDLAENRAGISPRLRVKANRENAFVKLGSVVEVPQAELKKNLNMNSGM